MRKSPLALLLSLICLISSHNEIQAQGHPPTDSLRQRAAASVGKEKHDLLMRIAMSTNDIADWDATLNDAIDRCDTPAICRSRLNRIQCLFNFYSVDSAIIEARESLPFILNAKQYSFYFSTYNTFISGLFKQRRFDEAREEATTMFETAQQVKQPVGMTMALQVQGSMYYKLGLYDQALTSLEKGIAICPTYENGENQVLYISAVLYEWLFMTALKVNDTERISRYADSYAALVKWRDEHGKVDPTGHYPVTSRSLQALSFLKKGQIKEARRLLDEAARFIHPQIPANAYEHFYEARRELRKMTGDYQGAIKGYGYPVGGPRGRPIFLYGRFVEESGTSGSFRRSPVLYIALSYVYTGERLGKPVGYRLSDGSTTDYLRGRPAQPREAIRKELDVRRLYRLLAPFPFASGIYYLFPTPKSEEPSTLQTHTGTDPAGK